MLRNKLYLLGCKAIIIKARSFILHSLVMLPFFFPKRNRIYVTKLWFVISIKFLSNQRFIYEESLNDINSYAVASL